MLKSATSYLALQLKGAIYSFSLTSCLFLQFKGYFFSLKLGY